jgi:hypothetical protein
VLAQQQPHRPTKCATLPFALNSNAPIALQAPPDILFTDSLLSNSGRFMIYYDSVASDTDSLTAPAYAHRAAEEADSAYDFEVSILGYSPPAFTEGTHHNIYLAPLHIDFGHFQPYGETFPMSDSGLPTSPSGNERVRSYCVVDNSFNDKVYATHGFDALRITIFHEFFHHIQFSEYGHPPDGNPSYVFFQEMSSVWMEWLSTPNVKDYLNYVSSYLSTIDTRFDLSPSEGYGQYLYFAYLTHRFDTSIVRKIWEYYRDSSNDPITCIDQVLRQDHGSSFCKEYEKFGAEVVQTGRRYSGQSILPDAQVLPVDTIPISTIATGLVLPLIGVVALSLQFADAGSGQDTCIEVFARDTDRNFQGNGSITFASIGAQPTIVLDDSSAYCDTEICIQPLSAAGLEVFPDPFISDGASQTFIFASNNSTPPISVVMNILDLNMNEVRSTKTVASPFRGTWNAVWDGRDDNGNLVASGEYLYSLHVDGALKVGKIVMVRK